jgi:thiamine monophosphate kinase
MDRHGWKGGGRIRAGLLAACSAQQQAPLSLGGEERRREPGGRRQMGQARQAWLATGWDVGWEEAVTAMSDARAAAAAAGVLVLSHAYKTALPVLAVAV